MRKDRKNRRHYEKEHVGVLRSLEETEFRDTGVKIFTLRDMKTHTQWLIRVDIDLSEGGINQADIRDRAVFRKRGYGTEKRHVMLRNICGRRTEKESEVKESMAGIQREIQGGVNS